MSAATTPNSALQAQLNAIKDQVESGFEDLRTILRSFDEKLEKLDKWVQNIERQEAILETMFTQRLSVIEPLVAKHEERLRNLEKLFEQLALTNRILQWLLGIFTALIIAGIIAFMGRLWQMMTP